MAAMGELKGKTVEDSGGERGRCGGGVAWGLPHSDDDGERAGDEFLGEY